MNLARRPLHSCAERSVERQRGELALAGAEVAGAVEDIALVVEDQDLVLQLADEVVADVELEQAVAEQRMLDGRAELPCALRLEIGVAAGDALRRRSPKLMKS